MSQERLTVQIKIKPHLKAFLLSVYGEQQPLFFPKKDKFNELLAFLLSKPPADYKPKPINTTDLQVIIPYFEHINIVSYNHLSRRSQRIFENRINTRFWVTYEDFLDVCFRHNIKRSEAITLFIEKYNLPYTTYIEDMLRKAIYRSRVIQKKYPTRTYTKRKKKIVR